ncbi:MAG: hypothetical protein WC933_03535 [Candidatus Paceibacterota bacterium]|jgi:hypothetical protein
MTAQTVLSTGLRSLGAGGHSAKNPFVDAKGIIATLPGYSHATVAAAATESNWQTGTKAKNIFIFPELWDVEDISDDPVYATAGNGNQKKQRNKIRRYRFKFDNTMEVHKNLQSFNNANLRFFTYDANNNLKAYKDGDTVKGFTASMVTVEEMTDASQAGDAIAESRLVVEFANKKEWDNYGVTFAPSWELFDLEALKEVYVEQVGGATATALTLRVYYADGYTAAGAINKIGVSGLVKADFTATTTAGVSQTTALSGTMTDNGDGTYDFICTALADGTVNLVAASALSSGYFDSHFGDSDGEAALDVT